MKITIEIDNKDLNKLLGLLGQAEFPIESINQDKEEESNQTVRIIENGRTVYPAYPPQDPWAVPYHFWDGPNDVPYFLRNGNYWTEIISHTTTDGKKYESLMYS